MFDCRFRVGLDEMHFRHLDHRKIGEPADQCLADDGNCDVDALLPRLAKMPMIGVGRQCTPRDKRGGPLVLSLTRHDRISFAPNIEALPGSDDG